MLFKHARRNVMTLKTELEHMRAFIKRLSWVEDPNAQAKLWIGEVRELSYDLEVTIDEFMLGVDATPAELKGVRGFIRRVTGLFTRMKTRCRIAKEIQGLKEKVKETGERRARYKIDDNVSGTSNEVAVDNRVRYLFKDQSDFVGVDGPKEELITLLTKGDDQDLQVVSIVGPGGLGKTTLAYQVYSKLGEEFKHRAFVSVSLNPNMMDVLRNIHSQLIIPRYIDTQVEELPQLLSEYRYVFYFTYINSDIMITCLFVKIALYHIYER